MYIRIILTLVFFASSGLSSASPSSFADQGWWGEWLRQKWCEATQALPQRGLGAAFFGTVYERFCHRNVPDPQAALFVTGEVGDDGQNPYTAQKQEKQKDLVVDASMIDSVPENDNQSIPARDSLSKNAIRIMTWNVNKLRTKENESSLPAILANKKVYEHINPDIFMWTNVECHGYFAGYKAVKAYIKDVGYKYVYFVPDEKPGFWDFLHSSDVEFQGRILASKFPVTFTTLYHFPDLSRFNDKLQGGFKALISLPNNKQLVFFGADGNVGSALGDLLSKAGTTGVNIMQAGKFAGDEDDDMLEYPESLFGLSREVESRVGSIYTYQPFGLPVLGQYKYYDQWSPHIALIVDLEA